jgi:carbamoylphosphate synthase large subunit
MTTANSTSDTVIGVVVDGYSAGNFYPAAFADLDVRLIHVQGTPELIPSMLAPNLSGYLENIVYTDDATIVGQLRRHSPVCVIAGQESAVPLADRLSELLALPSNGSRLSGARRDKYEMIETLRGAGLRCAQQFKSGDPAALAEWAQHAGTFPVVIKPLSSAATDGVYICDSVEAVVAATEKVLASLDIFGHPNNEVLIQSYLDGIEYIVDTVSSDGHCYVNGVWQYEKSLLPSGKRIYDKDILVDPAEAPVSELVAYVEQVLNALNIRWGPAHSEVIMTAEGPALVEIGARLNGNLDPGFHDVCLGNNQAAVAAKAYLSPEEFQKEFGDRVYNKLQSAIVYNTPTILDGIVDSVDDAVVDEIRQLRSVYLVGVKLRPGSRIRPTVDLLTSPLRVFLTAASDEQLAADYDKIRRLKDSVYRVK